MSGDSGRIVIIGAGIAGLCTAVYALRCGYRVEIVEKHETAGGLATSWRRGDYTFENCIDWLLGSDPESSMHARWQEVFDIDKLTFVERTVLARVETEQGESVTLWTDLDRLEEELLEKAPEDADEIRRFVADARELGDLEMPDRTDAWHRYWWTLLSTVPHLPALRRWSAMTCEDLGQRFSNPLLRAYFSGGEMAHLSAMAVIFSLAWMGKGDAGYPVGGSQAIIGPIVDRIREFGGRLRFGAEVAEIIVENDAAVGVRLADGERIAADRVISAGDGHAAIYDLLGGRYTDDRIDRIYRTMPTFSSYVMVSLGIAADLSQHPGSLVCLLDSPLAVDPETQLHQAAFRVFNYDPTLAPAGKTAVTCFLPTRNHRYWEELYRDTERYEAEKRRIADAVIAILDRHVPGIREAVEIVDVASPATVIRYTGNWKGSMEGWLITPATGFNPLPTTLPGLERFAMVGQWVQPGGGLPSGLMTARSTIRSLCRQDGVPFLPAG